ncbi:hypothetical protein H9L15_14465 [Sphingomonas daechungensis]|uniref:Uncharacterized protein n=1 Tax=Sphingomonas daechungensis TaxID=1176646 RepID=A0ABX6SZX0_9SPHN|nr:glycosyltransferase [Sphingomonas daechungensis]QNP43132.1 hypothetical protein H9L15_14465 [Sphingomonas daechungensis]
MSRKKSSGSGDATLSGVETAIPKKIHQIYFGDDLSERLKANARELRDLNPSWEYALYDAHTGEDYIRTHYGADVLQAYHHLDPRYYAARADLLRYLIVYREGGVYLDIKSRFDGPIDKFIRATKDLSCPSGATERARSTRALGSTVTSHSCPAASFRTFT